MSEPAGPWGQNESPQRQPSPRRPRRLLIWIGLLVVVLGGVWVLHRAFPGSLRNGEDWAWLIWGLVLFAFVSTSILGSRQVRWRQTLRHIAIWMGLVGVLILAITYRTELGGVVQRVRMSVSSSYPVATNARELVVTQSGDGAFTVMGKVNGQLVRFLVDTGASDTVLSPSDAERLGIDVEKLTFDRISETANGTGYGSSLTVESLEVGNIAFANMPVVVNKAPMSNSLLGLTFLKRLESFQVKGDRLYLRSHP